MVSMTRGQSATQFHSTATACTKHQATGWGKAAASRLANDSEAKKKQLTSHAILSMAARTAIWRDTSELFWLLDRANARGLLKFDHHSPPCVLHRASLLLNEGRAGFARHALRVVDGKVVEAWNGVDSLKTFQQMEAVVTGGKFRPHLRQNTSR